MEKFNVLLFVISMFILPFFRTAEKEIIKDIETDYFVEASYESVFEIIENNGYEELQSEGSLGKMCRGEITLYITPCLENKKILIDFEQNIETLGTIIPESKRKKLITVLIKEYGDCAYIEEEVYFYPKKPLLPPAYTKVIAPTWELPDKRIKVIECVPEDAEYPYFRIEVTYK